MTPNNIWTMANSLSAQLRRHFCKNYNIPIKIFEEPYFSDRCILLNSYYGIEKKLKEYLDTVLSYDNEQDYFRENNERMQSVIDYLKNNENMIYFSQKEDMSKFAVPSKYQNLSSKDVWRDSSAGKMFISIDLKKANFQALRAYSEKIFDGAESWEEFLGKFTDKKSEIHSKHLRQVIFGAINPKRQTTYEKFLMCKILEHIEPIITIDMIYSLNNDEIIIDIGNAFCSQLRTLVNFTRVQIKKLRLDCHVNVFSVEKLGKDMYRQIFLDGLSDNKGFTFKKVNHLMLPFVIRQIRGEEPTESDYVFKNESGYLCRFLKNPLVG